MDAFGVLEKVLGDYQSFVSGFLNIRDQDVRRKVETEIENGLLWPEPWLALNPAFESGGSVSELVADGVLHPEAERIFRARTEGDRIGREISRAIRAVGGPCAVPSPSRVGLAGLGSGRW